VLPAVLLPMERSVEESLGEVVVVYASDADGFAALLHSMLSLARHLQDPRSCVVHLIVPGEDLPRARKLLACFRRELASLSALPEVVLHELRPSRFNVSTLWRQKRRSDTSVAANLARNYLPDYLPDVPRVLWLDTDTIVQADVAPLFRTPLRHTVGAVFETQWGIYALYDKAPPAVQRIFEHDLADWSWFNPGVLIIDLERWKAENRTDEVESEVKRLKGWLIDTLALNLAFLDKFHLLEPDWNVQGLMTGTNWSEYELALRMAKILHWHNGWKPWQEDKPEEFRVNDHLFKAYDCRQPCDALD